MDPNILIIVIDALRARNLGCYGYRSAASANIDRLAEDGVLFERAFACTNATDSSLTTIFSGDYPTSHGIISHADRVNREDIQRFTNSQTKLLPEILKSQGYETLAIDWLDRWHTRGYDYYSGIMNERTRTFSNSLLPRNLQQNLQRKMDFFLSFLSRRYAASVKCSLVDEASVVTEQALHIISRHRDQKNFLLFLHYWDVHDPYAPPTRYFMHRQAQDMDGHDALELFRRLRIRPNRLKTVYEHLASKEMMARYDASIAYVDHEIGRLIDSLEKCGSLDRTIIVLTSDHGESLTEHGIYFDHHGLYDVSTHVPLIWRYPKALPTGKRIKPLVQHFDIVPTICDLLGKKSDDLDGRSMMPLIDGKVEGLHSAVFAEEAYWERKRAIRTSDYKYICALSARDALCRQCGIIHGGVEELYDLRKDPAENYNIVKDRPDVSSVLRRDLFRGIQQVSKG